MKVAHIILVGLLLGITAIAQNKIEYDKTIDKTRVVSPYTELKTTGRSATRVSKVELVSGYEFDGKDHPDKIDHFYLAFIIRSSEWQFFNPSSCYVILRADETRIRKKDKTAHTGRTTTTDKRVETVEMVSFELSEAELKSLIDAKTVELQLGSLEATLNEANLASIKGVYLAAKKH